MIENKSYDLEPQAQQLNVPEEYIRKIELFKKLSS